LKRKVPHRGLLVLLTLVSSFSLAVSSLAQAADPNFETNYSPTEIDYPGTNAVLHIGEAFPQFKSFLGNYSTDEGIQKLISCKSVDDPDCIFDSNTVAASASILPPCVNETDSNCIAGLEITTKGGLSQRAKLLKEIGGFTIPAEPKKGYIGGRSASVWGIDSTEANVSATHQVKYLIAANLNSGWDGTRLAFDFRRFSVSVIPFVERPGDFFADRWATELERTDYAMTQFKGVPQKFIPKVKEGTSGSDMRDCFFFDDKYCGLQTVFQANSRVKLDVRLSNEIGGWFHGRIKDPIISVDPISTSSNLISVDAEAITIPRLAHVVDHQSLDAVEKNLFDKHYWAGSAPRESYAGPLADTGETAFSFLNLLKDKVGDAAAGYTSTWNFTSIKAGFGPPCLSQTGKVLGIVSTNATAFESTAPKFIDGQLEYKVAGLHYGTDKKTENLGTYDLVIKSDVARCIYGFTKAPISASVSITGGSDQKIATTVVNEKNGWLKLAAYGFTYSEKTLQVKISQEPEVVITPSPTPSATAKPSTAKKSSITCVKGKTTKKVTAVKPKCPTGFKKK
jgi:hypothetical protein